jgi:hypothetical protein
MKQSSEQLQPGRTGRFLKYRMILLAGGLISLISLADLVFRGALGTGPSAGFMILAGSGMLGMVMRLRQRHVG